MPGFSNILEFSGTTTPLTEVAVSGTHSVAVTVTKIGNTSGFSNVLQFSGATAPSGYPSNVLYNQTTTTPVGYASNVLGLSATTLPTFGIDAIDQYVHGATSALTVYGATGSYTVRWSPSSNTATAPGSVQLTVVTDALDEAGTGTISVTANRGIVRYLDTGYVWLVQGTASNYIGATLALPAGREYVVLTSPLAPSANRLTAIPDLEVGDMLIWWNVSPSGDVSIEPDGSFNALVGVQTFEVEAHVANLGYTDAVTQSLIGEYELVITFTSSNGVSLAKTIFKDYDFSSTSSSESERGLLAKIVGVASTHSATATREVTAARARSFTSTSDVTLSFQVETPDEVSKIESFSSTSSVDFAPLAHTKPRAFSSTHSVSVVVTPLNAVPTITQIQPMTHNIQSIIIGINFGN